MTESQYLSSTDPAALRTLLVERGLWTKRKCRAFVEAWEYTEAAVNFPQRIDSRISSWRDARLETWVSDADWCIRNLPVAKMIREACAALIHDIWGNPWRCRLCHGTGECFSEYGPVLHRCAINPDWLTHANGNVVKLARAAVCDQVRVTEWDGSKSRDGIWTPFITGPIDPLQLTVLADALEEAGCTDEGILGHLRATERCPQCKGKCGEPEYELCENCNASGVVEKNELPPPGICGSQRSWQRKQKVVRQVRPVTKTYRCTAKGCEKGLIKTRWPCSVCNNTGTRPVQHIWTPSGGCWVLDLILGGKK